MATVKFLQLRDMCVPDEIALERVFQNKVSATRMEHTCVQSHLLTFMHILRLDRACFRLMNIASTRQVANAISTSWPDEKERTLTVVRVHTCSAHVQSL